jgi:hypothetical protein
MLDFFFFIKTFILTLIVVLCLQIDVDGKTVETHVHDWMVGSLAAGFLGHAAHGGAHMIKDATHKLSEQMKANIGAKHGHENSETKASRFHWGWEKKKPAANTESPEE